MVLCLIEFSSFWNRVKDLCLYFCLGFFCVQLCRWMLCCRWFMVDRWFFYRLFSICSSICFLKVCRVLVLVSFFFLQQVVMICLRILLCRVFLYSLLFLFSYCWIGRCMVKLLYSVVFRFLMFYCLGSDCGGMCWLMVVLRVFLWNFLMVLFMFFVDSRVLCMWQIILCCLLVMLLNFSSCLWMLKLCFLILCWVFLMVLVIMWCLIVLLDCMFSVFMKFFIWLEVKICIRLFFSDRQKWLEFGLF